MRRRRTRGTRRGQTSWCSAVWKEGGADCCLCGRANIGSASGCRRVQRCLALSGDRGAIRGSPAAFTRRAKHEPSDRMWGNLARGRRRSLEPSAIQPPVRSTQHGLAPPIFYHLPK